MCVLLWLKVASDHRTSEYMYEPQVSAGTFYLLLLLSGGISNVMHAMLLAGTKVLAMCGRSQLPTADTLMLILMVANRYHHNHLFPISPHSSTLASGAQRASMCYPS